MLSELEPLCELNTLPKEMRKKCGNMSGSELCEISDERLQRAFSMK